MLRFWVRDRFPLPPHSAFRQGGGRCSRCRNRYLKRARLPESSSQLPKPCHTPVQLSSGDVRAADDESLRGETTNLSGFSVVRRHHSAAIVPAVQKHRELKRWKSVDT